MGTLGHKLFEPITKPVEVKTEVEEKQADDIGKLYLKRTIKTIGTVEAVGMQTAEADGKLIENLLFTSPSYAAMFVIGKSANGLTSWKDADGHTLKSLESEIDE